MTFEVQSDVLCFALVQAKPDAGNVSQRFGRKIIGGRPQTAGGDHKIGLGKCVAPGPLDAIRIIADYHNGVHLDPDCRQAIGDVSGVGIYGATLHQLITGRNDGSASALCVS